MYIERVINPTEAMSFKNSLNKGHSSSSSFHDIFQQALNSKSSSRPPKLELTGLLIPCYQQIQGQIFRFKLGTESSEYFLSMNSKLAQTAKNAEWEEVTVKGHLNIDSNVFEVEKLTLIQGDEPIQVPTTFKEPLEIEAYERIINQRGKIEPAIEYLAS